ncbi:MAG TPA: peptide chain release factor aRF-1 [Candidatus Nanoarchaeia archaeon]|nr:peptide chain release factor aRF-1 [Candidatus Nanoarchaeia archaeon]
MDLKEKLKLKRFIRPLLKLRGRHTELVSVYIPVDYDVIKIIQQLQEEAGTATNIKDARTRNNVVDSLGKVVNHLRLFKRTPPHGMAVFAGNVSEKENKVDIQVFSIEPPVPISQKIYRCDQYFKLDILEAMLDEKDFYALILVDRKEATIGLLRGTHISVLNNMTSGVPGKFKAGGQSSQRLERLIDGMALEFYKRIAEFCNQQFLPLLKDLKGVIIGGPGHTKSEFAEELNNEIKKKIKGIFDVTYTDEAGLSYLVDAAKDIMVEESIIEEKAIVEKFLTTLAKEPSKASYGKEEVKEVLNLGAVDMLLVSESLEEEELETFTDLGEKYGSKIHIISIQTKEGQQLRELGGVAAILRYPVS